MDPDAKRPALVMVKSEDEKLSYFGMFQNFVTLVWCSKLKTVGKQQFHFQFCTYFADGQFVKSAIAEFVSSNKLPLVTIFTRESGSVIFESHIKKQVTWNV